MKVFLALFGLIYAAHAQQCGQSSLSPVPISSYIVGGQQAPTGAFPWQVGLVENGYLICGGTYVIGNDGYVKVISAAHCTSTRNGRYSVVFGMHSTTNTAGRLVYTVTNVNNHQNYNDRTMSNDISILSIGSITPAELASTFASPACLASKAYTENEMSVVSGWGTTSEGGSSSSVLRYVWKPLLDYTYCNTQTGNAGDLDTTMLCAGNAGKDACQGDSGGPLVVNRGGKWELVGVVSWGYGCGRDNYPGVYCDAWALRSWINQNL